MQFRSTASLLCLHVVCLALEPVCKAADARKETPKERDSGGRRRAHGLLSSSVCVIPLLKSYSADREPYFKDGLELLERPLSWSLVSVWS